MRNRRRLDAWVEDIAAWLLVWVGRRAIRQGDLEVVARIRLLLDAGAYAERYISPTGELFAPPDGACACGDPDCPSV